MPFISGSGTGLVSGVNVTGTAASGQVPVASSSSAGAWAYPPGFEIGYDQITAQVNVVSTTESSGTTVISCAAHTFDGAPVVVEFFSYAVGTPTAVSVADFVIVSLFEGATQIGRLGEVLLNNDTVAKGIYAPMCSKLRFTPSAAAHTYTVTAFTNSTTGTPFIGAAAGGTNVGVPAFCRFTKV